MPNLGDYIGRLLSEITIARMQADLESMRIAELYACDPLLRSMPVPHFRLPNIEIDLPIAIGLVEEKHGTLRPEAPTIEAMKKVFGQTLDRSLRQADVTLKPSQKKVLTAAIDKKAASLARPKGVAASPAAVAHELASVATDSLKSISALEDKSMYSDLEEELKSSARSEFLALQEPPMRLKVAATTAEVKEAGPSEVLTQIHLRIIEEAFEWTTIESEGKKRDKLVIE